MTAADSAAHVRPNPREEESMIVTQIGSSASEIASLAGVPGSSSVMLLTRQQSRAGRRAGPICHAVCIVASTDAYLRAA